MQGQASECSGLQAEAAQIPRAQGLKQGIPLLETGIPEESPDPAWSGTRICPGFGGNAVKLLRREGCEEPGVLGTVHTLGLLRMSL